MSWDARGVATVTGRASLLAAAREGAEGRWPAGAEGGADEGGVEGLAVEVEGGSVGAEESGGGGGGRGGDIAGERRDPSNEPPLAMQAVGVALIAVGSTHWDDAPACLPVSAVKSVPSRSWCMQLAPRVDDRASTSHGVTPALVTIPTGETSSHSSHASLRATDCNGVSALPSPPHSLPRSPQPWRAPSPLPMDKMRHEMPHETPSPHEMPWEAQCA